MPQTTHNFPGHPTPVKPPEIKWPPAVLYSMILLGLVLLVYSLRVLDGVLLPILFSGLLSLLLLPLCRRLEGWGMPRLLAIILCILLIFVFVAGLVYLFGSQIVQFREELPKLQVKLAEYFDQVQQFLSRKFGMQPVSKDQLIDQSIDSVKKKAGGYLGTTINTTTGVLSVLALVPIYIFCFLYYRDHLRQFLFRFVSPDKRKEALNTLDGVQTVVQAYITGLLTVIVIVAVLNAIGLLVLGVKYAIFFAVFASVLAVIPYIGIAIGATLPALITLVETGSVPRALAVVGVFLVVQFLEGNFITPTITGSKVSINPMAAIIALILGGELWGTPGMILSIPLIAVLKVFMDAYKPLEPFGFLLGDVANGQDNQTQGALEGDPGKPKGFRGFFNKLVGKS
ncbi:AI-2E family transporter [Hymenobacter latericus]|uniref:AI-2E family transporter n=1 Tax=Hymenobacter sp. YIM 151858-1 TaxID=2987688 RepID=UPI002227AF9B|nr:AI-2E family transporter [Hymenobacter sp. YIM 151858-1]UYZ60282.1 AI-2E family transporter [Hymenobacter sp. YIM 151858-1]